MMRIAVAGGGGLGYLIASELSQTANAYNVVVLSRTPRPELSQLDIQVHVVDYGDLGSLTYALQGTDLVISTVSGAEQLNLINAAGHGHVRLFVPAEFEGSLRHRPSHDDPLERGSSQAIALLQQWTQSSRMQYTVFSCGIFMERFHPYGLESLNISLESSLGTAGSFLVNINSAAAEFPEYDKKGHAIRVCLTSVYDVARFVVAAVDLGPGNWPREWTMRGDRMLVRDLVASCSLARNLPFDRQIRQYTDLQAYLNYYLQLGDTDKAMYYHRLLATADGRYDFGHATLNEAIDGSEHVGMQPVSFNQWLTGIWQPA